MSTRGWLIFKYQGQYYVIYNGYDSYPRGMGVMIAEQIAKVVKQHHGYVSEAREHWAGLFANLTFIQQHEVAGAGGDTPSHPFHTATYRGIQDSLACINAPVILAEVPSSDKPQSDGLFIEYLWEIDLDNGKLGMGSSKSGEVWAYWSWKSIYLLGTEAFLEDAEAHEEGVSTGRIRSAFRFERKVIIAQAQVRRFLCVRQALAPPDGMLYLLAKSRFESQQLMLKYAEDPVAAKGRKRSIEETV